MYRFVWITKQCFSLSVCHGTISIQFTSLRPICDVICSSNAFIIELDGISIHIKCMATELIHCFHFDWMWIISHLNDEVIWHDIVTSLLDHSGLLVQIHPTSPHQSVFMLHWFGNWKLKLYTSSFKIRLKTKFFYLKH